MPQNKQNPDIKSSRTEARSSGIHFTRAVLAATCCRLVLNTARRFAYPFAPALSRGLDVPLTAVTSLIAINQATGIIGLVFGPLADRFGYRFMMMAGMLLLIAGMFGAGLWPVYLFVLMALLLAGLGKNIFDPAVQAFAGKHVPFHRRGLVIGVMEFSWAASTLLGVPLIGLLIQQVGWRSAFPALGAAGLIAMLFLYRYIRPIRRPAKKGTTAVSYRAAWGRMVREPSALGAVGFSFFNSAANDNLFVVYGAWLEDQFGLGLVALGMGTALIGAAELLGEISTAVVGDRIGLKRSVFAGLILSGFSYSVLLLTDRSLYLALSGLFLIFMLFEFTVVCFISLSTELLPKFRATMMATLMASAGLGRVVGALIGGPVWLAAGLTGTVVVSVAFTALALISFTIGLRSWQSVRTK